jgi:glycosyltransferase involved in cell wall biosynthesis
VRIALVADTFPPLRTSGAVQLRDLVREMVRQGHEPYVLLPSAEIQAPWVLEDFDGAVVLRLRCLRTKDVNYWRRTAAEACMPFMMLANFAKSPLAEMKWDGVAWYAPTIFLGPVARALKRRGNCKGYLIIRDIFPEWAADMGLMSRGLPYAFFKGVAAYQYAVADVIGVQSEGNTAYFSGWNRRERKVEVLQNWLADAKNKGCAIVIDRTPLRGRKVLVYAGNMGVAQGLDIFLSLAERLRAREDFGFLFVGRGSEARRLSEYASHRKLENVFFQDEIHPDEVPGLLAQCHIGLVGLDPRHKTHNIPGKFLTYMQAGLPVLASINPGNDLVSLIEQERVGSVSVNHSIGELEACFDELLSNVDFGAGVRARCRSLYERLFSPAVAVRQIVNALSTSPTKLRARVL